MFSFINWPEMHGKTFYSVLVCDSSTLENALGDKPESDETKNGKLQVLPAAPDQSLVEYMIAALCVLIRAVNSETLNNLKNHGLGIPGVHAWALLGDIAWSEGS